MPTEKKSKKNGIEKLRVVLDEKIKTRLDPEDEKYLITLKKRLDEPPKSKIVIKKIVETHQTEEYSLKPKIVIHTKRQEIKPTHKIIIEEKPKQQEPEPIFKEVIEEKKFDEDLIEIKKVDIKQPEFIEVIPKTTKKQESTAIKEVEEFTEFEPVAEKKEQTEDKESIEPNKEDNIEEESIQYFIPVEKPQEDKNEVDIKQEETQKSFIEPEKKEVIFEEITIKEEPIEFKEVKIEKPFETDFEKEKKKEAFKEIQSIDEEIAILLYDNGYTNIDSLKNVTIKDLKKIKGIKKKKAKNIIFEIQNRFKEIEPEKPITEEYDNKHFEDEIEQLNLAKENVQELEENKISDEEKITAFNEIKSIDKKTALILYDNGYTSADTLKNTTIDELIKTSGIKKRKAKKIISEIEEKIIESADLKPITVDETTAEGELTSEQINEEKIVFEEEKDEKLKVELDSEKAEWSPVEEDIDFKEENLKESEEKSFEDDFADVNKDLEKIEKFTGIESIDEKTAVILYNNGYTDIDSLKNVTIKDLKKIKGIKKKKAKNIIFEIQNRFKEIEPEKPITEEYDAEYFEEEFDEDLKKVDEKIKNFKEPIEKQDEEETDFFKEEIEDVPEIKPDEKDESVFKKIQSIDDKIRTLLIENGIDTIEKLNTTSVKELIKIKGIRKKIAKKIKKEVELNVRIKSSENKESYENLQENPYIKQEDDQIDEEWESADSKKAIKKQRTIYGFMYNEYTLYEKEIITKSGSKRSVRFFSKGEPEDSKPIDIPDGYEVEENKSGVPYLRKIKG